VRDAANMIFKSTIGNVKSRDIINICSGNGYRIKDIVNMICDKINYYPEFIVDDSLFRSNDIPYQVGSSILMGGLYEYQLIYSIKDSVDCLIEGLNN
jgi:nucleoside-diphosphate-sugar epimerase